MDSLLQQMFEQRPQRLAWLDQPLGASQYVIFDIETTGGNPERNGITEICALRWRDGQVVNSFYALVNPRVPIPSIVRKMTGITNQMVKRAPHIEDVMPMFLDFIGDDILVSHNTIGDLTFLSHFAKVVERRLSNFFLCTHLLTEKLMPDARDKSLSGLCAQLGIGENPDHRAEADAYATLELFRELLDRLHKDGVRSIREAIRLQGDVESGIRLGWGVPPERTEKLPAGPGVFSLLDRKGKPLFVSSAFDVAREVRQLLDYRRLGKPLLKLVLQTYDIKATATDHIVAAMLDEAEQAKKSKLAMDPTRWHLRSVTTLSVVEREGTVSIQVGAPRSGAKEVLGPVHDRRKAGDWLSSLGEIVGGSVSRSRGLELSGDAAQLFWAWREGKLEGIRSEAAGRWYEMRYWFSREAREKRRARLAQIDKLLDFKEYRGVSSLLEENGVIAIARSDSGEWDVYPVARGRVLPPRVARGEWKRWLSDQDEGRELLADLRQQAAQDARADCGSEFRIASWVIHGWRDRRRSGCHYVPLKELATSEGE